MFYQMQKLCVNHRIITKELKGMWMRSWLILRESSNI